MKKPLTTTTKRIPPGLIRGRIYNESNKLVMLLIKQGPNYIRHVI
jgi:hypothetical protein